MRIISIYGYIPAPPGVSDFSRLIKIIANTDFKSILILKENQNKITCNMLSVLYYIGTEANNLKGKNIMFSIAHANEVLPVLKSIKTCLDTNDTFTTAHGLAFNLDTTAGICWHVYSYTGNEGYTGIGYEFLQPLFQEMGLDYQFPVEMQIVDDLPTAGRLYSTSKHLYKGETGELRVKLLDVLIKYFENILSKELA